jgi:hypothetical protein
VLYGRDAVCPACSAHAPCARPRRAENLRIDLPAGLIGIGIAHTVGHAMYSLHMIHRLNVEGIKVFTNRKDERSEEGKGARVLGEKGDARLDRPVYHTRYTHRSAKMWARSCQVGLVDGKCRFYVEIAGDEGRIRVKDETRDIVDDGGKGHDVREWRQDGIENMLMGFRGTIRAGKEKAKE